jgi:hypothetical protein
MSNGRNKYQSRENRQRVRRVLTEHWDPIGVVTEPDLDDEYDNYVGTVYIMLMDDRSSEDAIEQYLYETATGHIGLTPYEGLAEKCENTAAILVGLRPLFETH